MGIFGIKFRKLLISDVLVFNLIYTQRQWKVASKSHTLKIGQYLVHSERRTADTSALYFIE